MKDRTLFWFSSSQSNTTQIAENTKTLDNRRQNGLIAQVEPRRFYNDSKQWSIPVADQGFHVAQTPV